MPEVETATTADKNQPRSFTIPKFDKRLHDAKHQNWDCVLTLSHAVPCCDDDSGQIILQAGILDVDRFNILVAPTGSDSELWISKSIILCTEILKP